MTSTPALSRTLFWLCCAGFTLLALVPAPYLPPAVFNVWDKAEHAFAFAAMGGLGLLAYPRRSVRVLVGLLAFGAAIELAQAATGWRSAEWGDWLADGMGLALAALAVWLFARRADRQ